MAVDRTANNILTKLQYKIQGLASLLVKLKDGEKRNRILFKSASFFALSYWLSYFLISGMLAKV